MGKHDTFRTDEEKPQFCELLSSQVHHPMVSYFLVTELKVTQVSPLLRFAPRGVWRTVPSSLTHATSNWLVGQKADEAGKSSSESLILASTNPQYDKKIFTELLRSSVHESYKLRTSCVHKLF